MTTAQILIKVAQLLLSLSILIILHELGHFLPAKWFKTRVEKFYLFFDPYFSLFKFKKGETEYGIGWIPLGGYVKISGMIDESMDKEQMKAPPQPWEFRSKPAWQRLVIMVGGVSVNLILAFFIYALILWHWGDSYLPARNLTYGISAGPLGREIGLRNGDMILAVDHKPVDNFAGIPYQIIINEARTLQVERKGKELSLPLSLPFVRQLIKQKGIGFMTIRMPVIVDSVTPAASFLKGRLAKGDRIISLNGKPTPFDVAFMQSMQGKKDTTVALGVIRGGDTVQVLAHVNALGLIGFLKRPPNEIFTLETRTYSLLTAFPAGFHKAVSTLTDYARQLKLIFFSKEVKASQSVGGFITIGSLFPSSWDWHSFWMMTAFLSIILAFINILPIPALDGGHVLFLLYEIITRRKPSQKFMEYAQVAGMILIFGIILYANGMDIWRHIFAK